MMPVLSVAWYMLLVCSRSRAVCMAGPSRQGAALLTAGCCRSPGPHSYFDSRLMGLPYILFLDDEDLTMSYAPCGHSHQAQASPTSSLAFELKQMLRCECWRTRWL